MIFLSKDGVCAEHSAWPTSNADFRLTTFCRALEFLDIATGLEPDNAYNAFVRFKALLAKGDTEAAVAEIQRLMNCRGFDPDILRVRKRREVMSARFSQAGAEAIPGCCKMYVRHVPCFSMQSFSSMQSL